LAEPGGAPLDRDLLGVAEVPAPADLAVLLSKALGEVCPALVLADQPRELVAGRLRVRLRLLEDLAQALQELGRPQRDFRDRDGVV
jgi:hypothetical protein